MVDLELFNPASPVLVDCLKFCFIGVLRKELKEMAEEWNEHIISKSSNGGSSSISGVIRPVLNFFFFFFLR